MEVAIADIFVSTSPTIIGGIAGQALYDLAFQNPYKVLADDPASLGALIRDTIIDPRHNLRPEWSKVISKCGPKMHGGTQADTMYLFLIRLAVHDLLTR